MNAIQRPPTHVDKPITNKTDEPTVGTLTVQTALRWLIYITICMGLPVVRMKFPPDS